MNNTLTAKEWLDTNLIKDCLLSNKEIQGMDLDGYTTCSEAMELYAKGKTRILEDRIKEFREILKNQVDSFSNVYDDAEIAFLNEYDKHFNINKETI